MTQYDSRLYVYTQYEYMCYATVDILATDMDLSRSLVHVYTAYPTHLHHPIPHPPLPPHHSRYTATTLSACSSCQWRLTTTRMSCGPRHLSPTWPVYSSSSTPPITSQGSSHTHASFTRS